MKHLSAYASPLRFAAAGRRSSIRGSKSQVFLSGWVPVILLTTSSMLIKAAFRERQSKKQSLSDDFFRQLAPFPSGLSVASTGF